MQSQPSGGGRAQEKPEEDDVLEDDATELDAELDAADPFDDEEAEAGAAPPMPDDFAPPNPPLAPELAEDALAAPPIPLPSPASGTGTPPPAAELDAFDDAANDDATTIAPPLPSPWTGPKRSDPATTPHPPSAMSHKAIVCFMRQILRVPMTRARVTFDPARVRSDPLTTTRRHVRFVRDEKDRNRKDDYLCWRRTDGDGNRRPCSLASLG
jgi:hypothetical protein